MKRNQNVTQNAGWDSYVETGKQVDVVRFLVSLGYQRSGKQFSEDHKAGLIKKNEKGVFTRRAVHQYANRFLIHGANADKNPVVGEARKLQLQCEKLERENEEGSFKFAVLKGRYIPRQDMYLQLAGRAAVLDAGVEQFIRAKASELVAMVDGDQGKLPDFVDSFVNGWKDLLNTYANSQELEVFFRGEEVAPVAGMNEDKEEDDD